MEAKLNSTKPVTHIAIVLDESASMQSYADQTISAFNEMVQTIRQNAQQQDARVSLIKFSNRVSEVFFDAPVDTLNELTKRSYKPDGGTALYDAMAHAVDRFMALPDANDANVAFLVFILSDGEENSSIKDRNPARLGGMVKALKTTNRWTFTVMGANIDFEQLSKVTDIPLSNISQMNMSSVEAYKCSNYTNSAHLGRYMSSRGTGTTSSANYYGGDSVAASGAGAQNVSGAGAGTNPVPSWLLNSGLNLTPPNVSESPLTTPPFTADDSNKKIA